MAKRLSPGDVFYDIGANIGFFTLLGSRLVGAEGGVAAFEPLPANAAQLRHNLELNEMTDVLVVESAVAAQDGEQTFYSAGGRRDTGHLGARDQISGNELAVNVVSIDGWREKTGFRPPSVIKIDAEGAEVEVLSGAEQTIARHLPWILVEVHWLGRDFLSFVESVLNPIGYRASTLEGESLPSEIGRYHAVLEPPDPVAR